MKRFVIVLISLSIATIGCSKNITLAKGEQLYTVSGEPYQNSSCTITASVQAIREDSELLLKDCTVKNGKLFLSIPRFIPDDYLDSINLDVDLKSTQFSTGFEDSMGSGYIYLELHENNNEIENLFIYCNRNVAEKTLRKSDGEQRTIYYKKGWNMINYMYCENTDDIQSLYDKGYKWYVYYVK